MPVLLALSGVLPACRPDYTDAPTFSAERKLLQVVVETPAGTNHIQHLDVASGEFRPVRRAGLDQVVEFLPSPGNGGFIPGTHSTSPETPVSALVLAETQPAGTIVEVLPLSLVTLDDNGTLRSVVLAVPARPSQQILPETVTWQALVEKYPGVREGLRQWFQHQGRAGEVRVVSWKDEKAAEQYVRNSLN